MMKKSPSEGDNRFNRAHLYMLFGHSRAVQEII